LRCWTPAQSPSATELGHRCWLPSSSFFFGNGAHRYTSVPYKPKCAFNTLGHQLPPCPARQQGGSISVHNRVVSSWWISVLCYKPKCERSPGPVGMSLGSSRMGGWGRPLPDLDGQACIKSQNAVLGVVTSAWGSTASLEVSSAHVPQGCRERRSSGSQQVWVTGQQE
jgi:hypothetical protein